MIPPLGLLDRPNTRIQDYSHTKKVKARFCSLMPLLPSYPSSYGLIAWLEAVYNVCALGIAKEACSAVSVPNNSEPKTLT